LFQAIIATGTHADDPGSPPLAWPMPWDHFRNMTNYDLAAVYQYLTFTAQNEAPTGTNDKATQHAAIYCDGTHACPTGLNFTCHMDAANPQVEGNQCVGNVCTTDADCGACQHCTGAGPKACTAPDPTADAACLGAGI
jgi:hypothetical protein